MELIFDEQAKLEVCRKYAERKRSLLAGQQAMEFFGILTFGIERVSVADRKLKYVNTGDTYSCTVGYSAGEYIVTAWGDWYEENERQQNDEDGTITCCYCSHRTPFDSESGDDSNETVCENCGHCVDGSDPPQKSDDEETDENNE